MILKKSCEVNVSYKCVYSSDGAGRTGTYIAISNLLEQMKTEQAVDVFQAIKMIRGTRPQFVENAVSNHDLVGMLVYCTQ